MKSRNNAVTSTPGASLLMVFAIITLGLTGCGGGPTTPVMASLQADADASYGSLTSSVLSAMKTAIQDEFHAEHVYQKVVDSFGEVQPFYNILYAEQRHSEAIARLFENHGYEIPASQWSLDNVPAFASLAEACAAGVEAEESNIRMYDALLSQDLPSDVGRVFTNIRAASLESHLPAFEACCGCPG